MSYNLSSLPVLFLHNILNDLSIFDIISLWEFSITTRDHNLESNINEYIYERYVALSRYIEARYINDVDTLFMDKATTDYVVDIEMTEMTVDSRLRSILNYDNDIDYVPLYLSTMDKAATYPYHSVNAPNYKDIKDYYTHKLLMEFDESILGDPIKTYIDHIDDYIDNTIQRINISDQDLMMFNKYLLIYDIDYVEYTLIHNDSRSVYFIENRVSIFLNYLYNIFTDLMDKYYHEDRDLYVNIHDSAQFLNFVSHTDKDFADRILDKIYPDIDTTNIIIPNARYYTDDDGRERFNLDSITYIPIDSQFDITVEYIAVYADLKYMNMAGLIGLVYHFGLQNQFNDLNKTSCYDIMKVVVDSLRS